jgi:ubiquinone biosynthesis protein COQ9
MSGTEYLLEEKRRLLAATLPHVAFDGWSGAAMLRGARDAGLEPDILPRAFPGGAIEMVDFWIEEADRAMLDELARHDLAAMKVRERIALALRIRLMQQAGHREAIRRAMVLQALPGNAAGALKSVYRTVDAIWHAAGDTATDWNFYSKRLLLAGVYGSTVLYWLDDKSEGSAASWEFLERRLADVMGIQKLRGAVGNLFDRLRRRAS